MSSQPKVRRAIDVLSDDPEIRSKLAQAIANGLGVDDLKALAKIVRERPELIQAARGYLKN
jgi:hypothetical protein